MTIGDMLPAPRKAEAVPVELDSLPPDWLIWADAIERREDLRARITKKGERARYRQALARQAERGEEAMGAVTSSDETFEFVAVLREGADRSELHPPARPWTRTRRGRSRNEPRQ